MNVKVKICLYTFLIIFCGLILSNKAIASNNIPCATNSTCTIGEFLYDDSYVPITNATCTLNGRDPDNVVFFNNVSAPHVSDGRYEKTISTTGLAVGEYQTQLCCVTGAQNLCIDKTFVISTANLTQTSIDNAVTSIKGVNNKDLSEVTTQVSGVKGTVDSLASSMSTLVSDIWTGSTTSLNNLVSSVWSTSGRTLSSATLDSGTLATAANITSTENSIKGSSNKDLTQVSNQVTELKSTTDSIFTVINSLDLQISTISAGINTLLGKWGSSSVSDITGSLNTLTVGLGTTADTCALGDTVLGRLRCLTDKWGTESASTIYTAAQNAQLAAQGLTLELDYNGKSTTAYQDLQTLNSNLLTVSSLIGTGTDTASSVTIFGKIKQVQDTIATLDSSSTDLTGLLAKWGDYSATDIYDKVKNISSDISGINSVTNVDSILSRTDTITTDLKELKNTVYALKALVEVNKTYLDKTANQPIIKSWLEEGSIIFKNLITNPSSNSRQTVPLKFYLPKEAKLTDIMKVDPELSLVYDTSQGAIVVTGNYSLAPKETKIVSVEVQDVWKISDTEISAILNQTSELFDVLKGTAYFAQGSTLKSDIGVSLEKITRIQKEAIAPDARIMAYRTASDEMTKVKSEIDDLKSLVSSVSSNKSIFGYVGGSQLMSVWGIVAVMVAGFASLAIFIKNLAKNTKPINNSTIEDVFVPEPQEKSTSKTERIMFAVIILLLLIGGITYFSVINKKMTKLVSGDVKGYTTTIIPTENSINASNSSTINPTQNYVKIYTDIDKLTLRTQPNINSSKVTTALNNEVYTVLDKKIDENGQEWYQLYNNEGDAGWGQSRFFESTTKDKDTNQNITTKDLGKSTETVPVLVITSPDIKIINVRSLPNISSQIIQRVSGGVALKKISEVEDWVEVEAPSTKGSRYYKTGWIQKILVSPKP